MLKLAARSRSTQATAVAALSIWWAPARAGVGKTITLKVGHKRSGLGEPLTALKEAADLAARGVSFFALELIPRTTRAQSMDVLSSQANIAGYKAVMMAA